MCRERRWKEAWHIKDTGIQGVSVSTVSSRIKLEITDLSKAYNYFATHDDTLTFYRSMVRVLDYQILAGMWFLRSATV